MPCVCVKKPQKRRKPKFIFNEMPHQYFTRRSISLAANIGSGNANDKKVFSSTLSMWFEVRVRDFSDYHLQEIFFTFYARMNPAYLHRNILTCYFSLLFLRISYCLRFCVCFASCSSKFAFVNDASATARFVFINCLMKKVFESCLQLWVSICFLRLPLSAFSFFITSSIHVSICLAISCVHFNNTHEYLSFDLFITKIASNVEVIVIPFMHFTQKNWTYPFSLSSRFCFALSYAFCGTRQTLGTNISSELHKYVIYLHIC